MSTKRRPKKPALIPVPQETKVIPKDLQDQMGAVEACATAFNVLDKGYFPHNYGPAVKASLHFLAKLHEQTVEQAMKHECAHMVPELKEALTKAKEATGGQAEAQQPN